MQMVNGGTGGEKIATVETNSKHVSNLKSSLKTTVTQMNFSYAAALTLMNSSALKRAAQKKSFYNFIDFFPLLLHSECERERGGWRRKNLLNTVEQASSTILNIL